MELRLKIFLAILEKVSSCCTIDKSSIDEILDICKKVEGYITPTASNHKE